MKTRCYLKMVGWLDMAGLLETQGQSTGPNGSGAGSQFDDPALEQAIEYLGQRLYAEDIAIEIAKVVEKSPQPQPKILAEIAYRLAETSDVETDGDIKEENLSVIGMVALNEVAEIAEQAGMQIAPADVSAAFQEMVLIFAREQGLPKAQIETLAASMRQVDDAELAQGAQALPDDFDEQIPDEDVPVGDENAEVGAENNQQMMRV
jgi:hypothetical protein